MLAYVPEHFAFLSKQHKHVLLFTGLVAMVFGLILQAILHRMLSRPFYRMVDTAQNFAAGDKSARFDVKSANEFGFLAGFINQALDKANRSETALSQEKNHIEVMLHSIIVNDPVDRAMVEAIREVSHIMGVKTVAEWVENEETAEVLRSIGIDYAQGYFFGRPGAIGQWSQKCDTIHLRPEPMAV